ncbi:MAG: hypothetical protein RSP_04850 [Rhodanobacter sp.]
MFRPNMINARGQAANGAAVLAYLMETEHKLTANPQPPSAKAAVAYYQNESTVSVKGQQTRSTSRWLGNGATMLGLNGDGVNIKDMAALAEGYDPRNGHALTKSAGKKATWTPKLDAQGNAVLDKQGKPKGVWKGGHRVGNDCTFSISDKTVDLLFADESPEKRILILDAHRDAVSQVVSLMQTRLETGRNKAGIDKIGLAGIVASGHTHFGNRELEPNLHEHVLLYAVAPGADGKWGSFDANTLYDDQQMYGALGRAAFAKNLAKLGYGIEKRPELDGEGRETGEVYYRVAGISDVQREAFSTRRKQILEHVAKFGGTKQAAALATRKDKEEPDFDTLSEMWRQTFADRRRDDPTMWKSAEDLMGLPSELGGIDDQALLRKLHMRTAVWTKQDLIAQLARENVGLMDVSEVLHEADNFLQRMQPQLVTINAERSPEELGNRPSTKFTEDRYTAKWWIDELEQKLVDDSKGRQDMPEHQVPASTLTKATADFEREKGFKISGEQRAAVRHVTQGTGTSVITGHAGTGKTTVLRIVTSAYEAEGRHMIGLALANKAALKLQAETGMKHCSSAAKFLNDLAEDRLRLTPKSVVVLDEAGMADTQTLAAIHQAVQDKGAKLIAVGDAHQLQPVGPGAAFRLLKETVGDAKLTEIRRQRSDEDLKTSRLFYTHAERARHTTTRKEQASLGAQIFSRLEGRKQIEHTDTVPEAIGEIADFYMSSLGSRGDNGKTLDHAELFVMAGTRAHVRELNTAIRDRLKEAGKFTGKEHQVSTHDDRGQARELTIMAGDRLTFSKREKGLGVVNGTVGTVEAIKATAKGSHVLSVRIESDDPAENGRMVKFDTQAFDRIDHAYAWTIHKAQGATVEKSMLLGTVGSTDVHAMLVAATRARGQFRMFAAESDLELMAERMGLERLAANALEEGRKGEQLSPKQSMPLERQAPANDAELSEAQAERLWKGYQSIQRQGQRLHQQQRLRIRR